MTLSRRVMWSIALVAMCGFVTVAGLRVLTAQPEYVALKATCGPGSRPETGLQGLQTAAEHFSAPRTNTCNLELVGQYVDEGYSFGGAVYDTCAYLGKNAGPIDGKDGPTPARAGMEVIDVGDPRHPKAVAYLDNPGMLEPNESPAVHVGRKLLGAIDPYYVYDDARTAMRDDSTVAIYDVSNCRRPVLRGSLKLSHGALPWRLFRARRPDVLRDVLYRQHPADGQNAGDRQVAVEYRCAYCDRCQRSHASFGDFAMDDST